MPITVKKIDRGETLTFWERTYVPEIIRGLSITARHFAVNMAALVSEHLLFGGKKKRKIFTIYYPEEMPIVPVAYRGRPVLVRGADGMEKCVACGLCEVACPPACIHIVGGERDNGDRYPVSYILDGARCIFCGLCEEACPEEAIVMSDEWTDLCEYDRSKMIYDKEALLRSESSVKTRLDFLRKNAFSKSRY